MNRIEPITQLPDLDWLPHCRREIEITGPELISQTDAAWIVDNILIVGFIYRNFLAPPWMWFALAKGVTLKHLIDFRRLVTKIPIGTMTAVRADFAEGIRFAKLYRFEEVGAEVESQGEMYKLFRRV